MLAYSEVIHFSIIAATEANKMNNTTDVASQGSHLPQLCEGDRKYFIYQVKYGDALSSGEPLEVILDRIHNSSHPTTCEDALMHFQEHRTSKLLLLYVPPILIILGTLGNLMSCVILCRKAMRKFSTYTYLAVLSLTDTLVLHVGLMRLWVAQLTGYDVRDTAGWLCKVVNFTGYTVSDYSVWLIVAVTVERYIVVANPLRATTFCTNKRALFVIFGILALLLAVNMHIFWTVELAEQGGRFVCRGGPGHEDFVEHYLPWLDAILYSIAPFLILLFLNILIINKVVQARHSRKELQSGSVYSDKKRIVHGESGTKLTVMLLTISFSFLITTLPMMATSIAIRFWNNYHMDLRLMARFSLVRTVTELLMYVNHSMNFIIYCVTGNKFRQQLLWLLCSQFPSVAHEGVTQYSQVRHRYGTARVKNEQRNGTTREPNKFSERNTFKSKNAYAKVGMTSL